MGCGCGKKTVTRRNISPNTTIIKSASPTTTTVAQPLKTINSAPPVQRIKV